MEGPFEVKSYINNQYLLSHFFRLILNTERQVIEGFKKQLVLKNAIQKRRVIEWWRYD